MSGYDWNYFWMEMLLIIALTTALLTINNKYLDEVFDQGVQAGGQSECQCPSK